MIVLYLELYSIAIRIKIVDLFTETGGNQMKNKILRKICSILCACMIVCGVPMAAFAAEPDDLTATVEMDSSTAQVSDAVVPYANPVVTGSIPALKTRTFTVRLNSYIGLSKTFRVTAQSSASQGGIDITLKKGDKFYSDGNWIMGVNDTGDWKFTLPSSGDYTVQITNLSSDVVYVTMQWV